MNWRWLVSRTYRQAAELRKHVWYIFNSQRDELADRAVREVAEALAVFDAKFRHTLHRATLRAAMADLEKTATLWLKPYPYPGVRENLKEFLVSGVLILGIFSFFLQPMKIPSGSAQPTLYGNVITDLTEPGETAEVPPRWRRFVDWFRGIDYHRWVARDTGVLMVEPPATTFGFIKTQRLTIGRDSYTFFWPPERLLEHLRIRPGQTYQTGQEVFRLKISSGDRLFVDRMTYNFRRPRRGEIIVFHTVDLERKLVTYRGQDILVDNTHYIKRLVALGGERVRIGDDRHVYINGRRLDANTPGFRKVYSFNGPPRDSVYSGHVNNKLALQYAGRGFAPLFPDGDTEFQVRPNHYLAFGDNTMNSWDGRGWGDFPREHVVGRACFVFWPLTRRWGPIWE
jgi:signal peptidase I